MKNNFRVLIAIKTFDSKDQRGNGDSKSNIIWFVL